MQNIDVAQMKTALAAVERRLHDRKRNVAANFATTEAAFRRGMASRKRALGLLAVQPERPFAPAFVTLNALS